MNVILNEDGQVIDIKDYPKDDKVFDDKEKEIERLNKIYTVSNPYR